jgi:hypothetical protein
MKIMFNMQNKVTIVMSFNLYLLTIASNFLSVGYSNESKIFAILIATSQFYANITTELTR